VAILLGTGLALIIQRNVRAWDRSSAAPTLAKVAAFLSLVLWIGVILAAAEVANYSAA
jgi:hypothetical protein